MKPLPLILALLAVALPATAQLVPCRPKLCLFDYNLHDDRMANNPDMLAIKSALPDLLIDNTPHGLYGDLFNNGVGCLPANYTPLGIQVFSYLTGQYEGKGTPAVMATAAYSGLSVNLARIDGIATDGASVFLDEITAFPSAADKIYLSAISARCKARNIKLILNPGTSNFDSWLTGICDYILSDEHYTGTRSLTASESLFADHILVVNTGVTSAPAAAAISLGARANGFGYSYACMTYVTLPISWLGNYVSQIVQPLVTPTITVSGPGTTLQSNSPVGNQWYKAGTGAGSGIITGATGQTYIPTTAGSYYTIVTLNGCRSTASNTVLVTITAVTQSTTSQPFLFFPNPAHTSITFDFDQNPTTEIRVTITDLSGKVVQSATLTSTTRQLDLRGLSVGLYVVTIQGKAEIWQERLSIY